jgi:hypothetical protein
MGEEILEIHLLRQLLVERLRAVSGQPAEDLVDLGFRAALSLRLGDIKG